MIECDNDRMSKCVMLTSVETSKNEFKIQHLKLFLIKNPKYHT